MGQRRRAMFSHCASSHFSPTQWGLAILSALFIGMAKSGIAGLGMLPVLLMADVVPARESTGIVLPLLICGDFLAVGFFKNHAQWLHLRRLLPPAILGVVVGFFFMQIQVPDARFRQVIGGIVLLMAGLHALRRFSPKEFERVPHTRGFGWAMGCSAGVTTMLANAAGPVMTLYLLSVDLTKLQFVGTSAWFFLMVNLIKVPFSWKLGLIGSGSLQLNLLLFPAVAAGILAGRWLLERIPQRLFEQLALGFAVVAALRLVFA